MPRSGPGVARFGQYLGRRRDLLGLSIEVAAERAGLTVREVRAIETGARLGNVSRTARRLAHLADALSVPAQAVTLHLRTDCPDIFDRVVTLRRGGGPYGGPARARRDGIGRKRRVVTRAQGRRATALQGGNTTPTPDAARERTA
jgi:transcriptional regulator with XRE-family HTH domain